MWPLTACKISVNLSFLNWIKNEMIFYGISEFMVATLIQRYVKKSFHFKNERLPHFIILLIPYKTFLIRKCLFLRNMEPLFIPHNKRG